MLNNEIKKPEVLAPAGDTEKLRAAIDFGADAVYLSGKQFGMRSAPKNFTESELSAAVSYAHERGARVYVTCNALLSNSDIVELEPFVRMLSDVGADAVIVSDVGALGIVKKSAPALEAHISVQTGIFNYESARVYHELGASRVILSRELSLDMISEIRAKTPRELQLEAFVHGSICVSFSGRCLLSDYMTDRSSARGDCAQPCRWKYALMEEKRPGEFFPVFEDSTGSYILNSHDLCLIEHIPELTEAGIDSFKIEGRAKSAYYAAVTTNAYRCAVDEFSENPDGYTVSGWILDELRKVSHRPYSTGFFFGNPKGQQCYDCGGYIREYIETGVVTGFSEGMLTVTEKNRFSSGDCVDILSPGKRPVQMTLGEMFLPDGTRIDVANHPEMTVLISSVTGFAPGSIMRKIKE